MTDPWDESGKNITDRWMGVPKIGSYGNERAVSEEKDEFCFFCTLKESIFQVELHVKQSKACDFAICSLSWKKSAEFMPASCELFNPGVVVI